MGDDSFKVAFNIRPCPPCDEEAAECVHVAEDMQAVSMLKRAAKWCVN
jgi:hypothetical protein